MLTVEHLLSIAGVDEFAQYMLSYSESLWHLNDLHGGSLIAEVTICFTFQILGSSSIVIKLILI